MVVKNGTFQILLKADKLQNCEESNKHVKSNYHHEKIHYSNKNTQVKEVEHIIFHIKNRTERTE